MLQLSRAGALRSRMPSEEHGRWSGCWDIRGAVVKLEWTNTVGRELVPGCHQMSTRCNNPKGLDMHEAPVSGPPGVDLVEWGDDRGVAAAIGRTTRQQEALSSEVPGERTGESSDRRADHPIVSVANEDSALVRGCLVAVDARDQAGPCSPGCSSAIVINKISIRAVSIRAPLVICGIPVMAVIDSGAEVTVISDDFYSKIPKNSRPPLLESDQQLVVADKQLSLHGMGVAHVSMRVSQIEFKWHVHVAPITDNLLLGCDVLDALDMQVSPRRGLWVKDRWLPCKVTRKPCGKTLVLVVLQEVTEIPAHHELVTWGGIPRGSWERGPCALLEPVPKELGGILVARALVDTRGPIPVRLVNLTDAPVIIPPGCVLGELSPVSQDQVPMTSESANIRNVTLDPDSHQSSSRGAEGGLAGEDKSPTSVPEHLQELYHETCRHVNSPSVRQRLAGLLVRRQRVFARNCTDLGSFTKIKHEINTNGAAPVRERVRRTPRGFEGEEEKCLQEQLQAGVIRPSPTAWAAPTVLVRKSDGTVRWCIDYRSLNDRSVKDAYPLPRIDMCFDSLGGVRYFSTLDLQSGYWQIKVEEADIHKTAFITKYGLFECIKMPFGLCSAPSTFQRCMELVFRGLQWCTLLIYLDDIIILGRTMEENLDRLDEALGRLEEANLKLKPSKCKLLQQEVLFLGHIVSADGVRPNPKLVESICSWEPPKDRRGVQRFLGLCNYYRRFVPDFSVVANPLTDLTSKSKEFEWTASVHQAFEKLKVALSSAPVLSFPLPSGDYILDTNASDVGVGGVLSQDQNGVEWVIAFSSKKLNKQQRRYCVTPRELLAVVTFLREFRVHLLAREFTIRTDHSSLTWLLRFKEPQGQLARWLEYIFQFKFRIIHRPGKKHGNADALSRAPTLYEESWCEEYLAGIALESLPCGGCPYCTRRHEEWSDFHENVDVVPLTAGGGACRQVTTRSQAKASQCGNVTDTTSASQTPTPSWIPGYDPAQLRAAQLEDADLHQVHRWMDLGRRPSRDEAVSLSPAARSYWLNLENLRRVDGVLYLNWVSNQGLPDRLRLLVPRHLRTEVLTFCHDSLFSGHMGVHRTVKKVKQRFHWPGLSKDVKVHICSCATCNANRMPYQRFRAALVGFRVGAPLDRVGIDLIGPLPVTEKGNRYLLVIVDYFTRWAEAFPLPDQQAETVAKTFVHEFVCRYGAPLELHSDQGRNFECPVPRSLSAVWNCQDQFIALPPKFEWPCWKVWSYPGCTDPQLSWK